MCASVGGIAYLLRFSNRKFCIKIGHYRNGCRIYVDIKTGKKMAVTLEIWFMIKVIMYPLKYQIIRIFFFLCDETYKAIEVLELTILMLK